MKKRLALPIVVLVIVAADDRPSVQPNSYRKELALLAVPAKDLPAGCELLSNIRTAPLLPIDGNPYASDRKKFVSTLCVIGFGLDPTALPRGIRAGLVVLYQDQNPANEVGVYALLCDSEKGATKVQSQVIEPLRATLIRKGRLLIRVWKDDGASEASLNAVRRHLENLRMKP